MSSTPLPVFRCRAERGGSSQLGDHPGRVVARKLQQEIDVRFTTVACTVQTAEGLVHAVPGDAIITGTAGERWRVSRVHFADKYRPVPPTAMGEAGRYLSLPNEVLAVPMDEPFEVLLADGRSRLRGRRGDWLVDYGDGSLGVVSQAIFASTYEIL